MRNRLRVLHASPTWFSPESVIGGGERWVDNVMSALSVAAPWISQAMVSFGAEDAVHLRGQSLIRLVPNQRKSAHLTERLSASLWDEFAAFDVIHVHQALTDFGAYACCVGASLGRTLIATDLGGSANPIMTDGGLRVADGVVAISQFAHGFVGASAQTPSIVLIGPVDTDAFRPSQALPPAPAVICVSRIMPHKGIDRIVRALPNGLKLRIVGQVYHDEYRKLLGELASGKDVEFIHDADDEELLRLYRSSTLFAQASCFRDIYGNAAPNTELMGLTTLEAMSCGLPVVVSADGGSLPELVTDTTFGRVFRTHDDLARILLQHQAGEWPSDDASIAARSHVVATCGMQAYGTRLAAFYADIHRARTEGPSCASCS